MKQQDIRLLMKMKQAVVEGKCYFKLRNDRDYKQDLLDIGITESECWEHILSLNSNMYFPDPKPIYYQSEEILIFKKNILGNQIYIKLKYMKDSAEVECWSFHINGR